MRPAQALTKAGDLDSLAVLFDMLRGPGGNCCILSRFRQAILNDVLTGRLLRPAPSRGIWDLESITVLCEAVASDAVSFRKLYHERLPDLALQFMSGDPGCSQVSSPLELKKLSYQAFLVVLSRYNFRELSFMDGSKRL
jgi:hypothetical protein